MQDVRIASFSTMINVIADQRNKTKEVMLFGHMYRRSTGAGNSNRKQKSKPKILDIATNVKS